MSLLISSIILVSVHKICIRFDAIANKGAGQVHPSFSAASSMGNSVIGADHRGPEIDLRQASAYDLRRQPWMNHCAPDGSAAPSRRVSPRSSFLPWMGVVHATCAGPVGPRRDRG